MQDERGMARGTRKAGRKTEQFRGKIKGERDINGKNAEEKMML